MVNKIKQKKTKNAIKSEKRFKNYSKFLLCLVVYKKYAAEQTKKQKIKNKQCLRPKRKVSFS